MKKGKLKKGFTLVEIIVVVAILGIIAGIFAVNMIKTLDKNKQTEQNQVVYEIKSAADAYISTNSEKIEKLYTGYAFVDITVGELREAGLIEENIKNPDTGEIIPDTEKIRVSLNSSSEMDVEFPVENEVYTGKTLIAEDLYLKYDEFNKETISDWCGRKENIFAGWNTNDQSRMYIIDEDNKISFADELKKGITATSCNVNPQIAGQYQIVYEFKYNDENTMQEVTKTTTRNVTIGTSTKDVESFSVTINNLKSININATNVPINIVENYTGGENKSYPAEIKYNNGKYAVSVNSDSSLYSVSDFDVTTVGSRNAVFTRLKTNSNGSVPSKAKANYTVTNEFKKLCPSNSSSCYVKNEENYVKYMGQIFRLYYVNSNKIKLILEDDYKEGSTSTFAYGQLGYCTNNTCCNSGRWTYNVLGATTSFGNGGWTNNWRYQTMNTTLNNFYNLLYKQNNNYPGLMKTLVKDSKSGISSYVTLLSKEEFYNINGCNTYNIGASCNNSYITKNRNNFWLLDHYNSSVGSGAYNKGANESYAYDYMVNINATSSSISYAGSSKVYTYEKDYKLNSVSTALLAVRPTVMLSNVVFTSGDGTVDSPYIVGVK